MTTDVSGAEPGVTPTAPPLVPVMPPPVVSPDTADTQVLTEADVAALMAGAAGPLPSDAPADARALPLGGAVPGVAGASEATLACPECGTVTTVNLARRSATDFCPGCDYPLFWARPEHPVGEATPAGEDARRRLPGAYGTTVLATAPCPVCAELNLPAAEVCVRCGSSMEPPVPPAPMPMPMPEPVVVVVPPPPLPAPERLFPWWWLVATAAIAAAMVGLSSVL
ncbi:hypothetical protein [Georgenia ruanii]|uniref:hypothetical protein n=1 Tax=Georgenia ruanii TaxID=348442 RepID=UPI001264E374|nr:hypothetical protein [Georgenia ruanii]